MKASRAASPRSTISISAPSGRTDATDDRQLSLQARERQIVASYTEALSALLAEETGVTPDDIEPRVAAEAMMAFHRSLIDFARRRAVSRKSGAEFASEIRAAGEHALTLLEGGLGEYGGRAAPHTSRDNS